MLEFQNFNRIWNEKISQQNPMRWKRSSLSLTEAHMLARPECVQGQCWIGNAKKAYATDQRTRQASCMEDILFGPSGLCCCSNARIPQFGGNALCPSPAETSSWTRMDGNPVGVDATPSAVGGGCDPILCRCRSNLLPGWDPLHSQNTWRVVVVTAESDDFPISTFGYSPVCVWGGAACNASDVNGIKTEKGVCRGVSGGC